MRLNYYLNEIADTNIKINVIKNTPTKMITEFKSKSDSKYSFHATLIKNNIYEIVFLNDDNEDNPFNIKYRKISDSKKGIIFLLWGNFAQSKEALIDTDKHFVLKAAHPSPLARGAFFGCKHFSKTNKILEHNGIMPIDWRIE